MQASGWHATVAVEEGRTSGDEDETTGSLRVDAVGYPHNIV
jgi:hypothetical protein